MVSLEVTVLASNSVLVVVLDVDNLEAISAYDEISVVKSPSLFIVISIANHATAILITAAKTRPTQAPPKPSVHSISYTYLRSCLLRSSSRHIHILKLFPAG